MTFDIEIEHNRSIPSSQEIAELTSELLTGHLNLLAQQDPNRAPGWARATARVRDPGRGHR